MRPTRTTTPGPARPVSPRRLRGTRRLGALLALVALGGLVGADAQARNIARTERRSAAATADSSVRHRIVRGENLYRIALSYGVTVSDLCRANGIEDSNQVTEGRVLFVPVTRSNQRKAPAKSRASGTPRLVKSSVSGDDAGQALPRASGGRAALPARPTSGRPDLVTGSVITNDDLERLTAVRPPAEDESPTQEPEEITVAEGGPEGISFDLVPTEEPFSWPVQGGIVRSSFGMRRGRQHAGIDICAPTGSPIYAARDGVVSYSGRKFRGYGNVVMVDHGDGFTTVYAHNVANLVREDEPVIRGQIIARVGATGNATGSHCHFEIRNENVSVDPRGYLAESPEDDVIFATGGPRRSALGTKPSGIASASPDLIP